MLINFLLFKADFSEIVLKYIIYIWDNFSNKMLYNIITYKAFNFYSKNIYEHKIQNPSNHLYDIQISKMKENLF